MNLRCKLGLHAWTRIPPDIYADAARVGAPSPRLAEVSPWPGGWIGPRVSPYCLRCGELSAEAREAKHRAMAMLDAIRAGETSRPNQNERQEAGDA